MVDTLVMLPMVYTKRFAPFARHIDHSYDADALFIDRGPALDTTLLLAYFNTHE
jgi:hypothetical protein